MTANSSPEQRARGRAKSLTDVLWHIGAFVIINAFFWLLDVVVGTAGVQWAFWITLFWGFALAFHILTYLVAGRAVEDRAYDRYVDEERRSHR